LRVARLCEELCDKRGGVEAYKEVLTEQPFAVEIYQDLVSLGADAEELLQLYGDRLNKIAPWIVTYLTSQRDIQRLEYKASLASLSRLEDRFKGSLVLLLAMAHCNFKQLNMKESYSLYKRVRVENRLVLDFMDQFAAIIKFNGDMAEMNQWASFLLLFLVANSFFLFLLSCRLAEELLDVSQERPEPWLVMSRYCEMKGDIARALTLADKAIKLRPRHANSYLLKGGLLLGSKPSEALQAISTAYEILPDMDSVRGVTEAYNLQKRPNEALALAKEVLQKYPKNPRALTLIGSMLTHRPDSRDKARKALTNALLLDPNSVEAVVTMVTLLMTEGNVPEAVRLLEESVARNNSDYLHVRLADIYTLSSNYGKALEHYGVSLSFNPFNPRALDGIRRVEKLMGGEKAGDGAAEEGDGDDPMNG